MKTRKALCIGGPRDGEYLGFDDYQRYLQVPLYQDLMAGPDHGTIAPLDLKTTRFVYKIVSLCHNGNSVYYAISEKYGSDITAALNGAAAERAEEWLGIESMYGRHARDVCREWLADRDYYQASIQPTKQFVPDPIITETKFTQEDKDRAYNALLAAKREAEKEADQSDWDKQVRKELDAGVDTWGAIDAKYKS